MIKKDPYLIVGGMSSVGMAVFKNLISQGEHVVFTGTKSKVQEMQDLKNSGEIYDFFVLDLMNSDSRNSFVSDVTKKDLSFKGSVFSAATNETMLLSFTPSAQSMPKMMRAFEMNACSQVAVASELVQMHRVIEGGSIVFVSSVAPQIPMLGNSSYSASKAALNSMVKFMAFEMSKRTKIRFNTVSPGQLTSGLTDKLLFRSSVDELNYPLGYGKAEDVSELVCFLLSDKAKWITGSDFVIDGGRSCITNFIQ